MALGDDYITKEQLKERLGINDAVDAAVLSVAVSSATDGINTHCRRDFQKADAASARKFRATDAELVIVDDFHSTTGLILETDEDDDGVFETVWDATDFELEPLNGVVDGKTGWPYWRICAVGSRSFPTARRAGVRLTAPWGWADVPSNVVSAAYVIAEDVARLKDTAFGVGGYSEFGRIRARENPHAATFLQRYRRNTVRIGG